MKEESIKDPATPINEGSTKVLDHATTPQKNDEFLEDGELEEADEPMSSAVPPPDNAEVKHPVGTLVRKTNTHDRHRNVPNLMAFLRGPKRLQQEPQGRSPTFLKA